eukprot:2195581-Pyramimonas_sp.AAC.1
METEEEASKAGLEEDGMMHPREGRPGILTLPQGTPELKGEIGHQVTAWMEDVRVEELVDVVV